MKAITSPLLTATFMTVALGITSCNKPEITVYEIPKESRPQATPLPGEKPPAEGTTIVWNVVPEGWNEQPASGMRKGTFQIPATTDTELAITAFPGDVGGLLANVNRWRGQVDLAPIDATTLPSVAKSITVDGHPAHQVDLIGTNKQILGVIVPLPKETWFFKLAGPPNGVTTESGRFADFITGLHVHNASHNHASPSATDSNPPAQPTTAKQPSQKPKLSFEAPAHWEEKPLTPMRIASFKIPGKTDKDADLSIVSLGGKAGGPLANVNRWRGQLGLSATTQPELDASLETIPSGTNTTFVMLLIENNDPASAQHGKAILAALAEHNDHTWFVKMTGDASTLRSEQETFKQFLTRIQLPN